LRDMIETIRLVPSKRRIWLGFIASIFLVGLGCVAVHRGHTLAWIEIALFSLGIAAPGLLLLPGALWLELDKDGFTLCMSFRQDRYLWRHITELAIWNGIVSFKLAPEHRGNKRGQTVSRAVSRYDGGIPDIFRLSPLAMFDMMMKYKQNDELVGEEMLLDLRSAHGVCSSKLACKRGSEFTCCIW
jgi:hypothetical protein